MAALAPFCNPDFDTTIVASLCFAIGFHKVALHTHGMVETSEYASLEVQAFSNVECPEWEMLPSCIIKLMRDDPSGTKAEGHYEGKTSLSDQATGSHKMFEITCKACGLSVPFDVLETNNPEYDQNANLIAREQLSKSGAQRRKEEARVTMDEVAIALNFDNKMILEANRLFNQLHKAGGSSGGRGFKTIAAAALHLASLNAGKKVSLQKVCNAHPEKPVAKIANRLIKDARRNGHISKIKVFSALEKLDIIAAQIGADQQTVEFAKKYANMDLPLPADTQAAAALYIAAGLDGKRKPLYSGASLMRLTGINRRAIYKAARLLQPAVRQNPVEREARQPTMPASIISELRSIRRN